MQVGGYCGRTTYQLSAIPLVIADPTKEKIEMNELFNPKDKWSQCYFNISYGVHDVQMGHGKRCQFGKGSIWENLRMSTNCLTAWLVSHPDDFAPRKP